MTHIYVTVCKLLHNCKVSTVCKKWRQTSEKQYYMVIFAVGREKGEKYIYDRL